MNIHKLKTVQPFFNDVANSIKKFEVRKDDRNYQIGDRLDLFVGDEEIIDDSKHRPHVHRFVVYKLKGGDFGIADGYCVLGLSVDDPNDNRKDFEEYRELQTPSPTGDRDTPISRVKKLMETREFKSESGDRDRLIENMRIEIGLRDKAIEILESKLGDRDCEIEKMKEEMLLELQAKNSRISELEEGLREIANDFPEWNPTEQEYDCQIKAKQLLNKHP